MAFEALGDRLSRIFKKIRGQATLTEKNMEEMLSEVKRALLEADVNYTVVNDFIREVREESVGQKVLTKVSPGNMVVKIVHDKMEELLGSSQYGIITECNAKALSKGIKKLLFDNRLKEEYEKNATERGKGFSIEASVQKTEDFFNFIK